MHQQRQQIIARCNEVIAKIKVLYGLDLSIAKIDFNLKGACAGRAYRKGNVYGVRFNHDMLGREAFDHVLNDTTPHEYAHLVCYMNPKLGSNHDYGWQKVCIALGGSGARCHNEEVVFGKGMTFEYTSRNGKTIRLSEARHQRIQRGGNYSFKKGIGLVDKTCSYTIVGNQGHTFAEHRQVTITPRPPTTTPVKNVSVTGTTPRLKEMIEEFFVKAPTPPKVAPTNDKWTMQVVPTNGATKADVARAIMMKGKQTGASHETMIQAIMAANGHSRSLAKSYFINNVVRCGIQL